MKRRILVVDDNPRNVKLLVDTLAARGYEMTSAESGEQALASIRDRCPDLVLLDVMMPGIDGYETCRRIRADESLAMLPVIMVTALDSAERVNGLDAGADDFITKPFNTAELYARVRSLLRIKTLYDEVQAQRRELAEWNRTLEARVTTGVAEIERLSRLKRFFSPQVADLILAGGTEDPLRSHRSEIAVVFIDLRGYTSFVEVADPEDVMGVLREYHAAMGSLILKHQGTLERFAGDSIMIFFNDPVPVPSPAETAVRMALDMHSAFRHLAAGWRERGYALDMGIGIAQGYATIGAIGFEGRRDYGAIGTVCSLAARLCEQAKGGQTLLTQRVRAGLGMQVVFEPVGELVLKGFLRPVVAYNAMEPVTGV